MVAWMRESVSWTRNELDSGVELDSEVFVEGTFVERTFVEGAFVEGHAFSRAERIV